MEMFLPKLKIELTCDQQRRCEKPHGRRRLRLYLGPRHVPEAAYAQIRSRRHSSYCHVLDGHAIPRKLFRLSQRPLLLCQYSTCQDFSLSPFPSDHAQTSPSATHFLRTSLKSSSLLSTSRYSCSFQHWERDCTAHCMAVPGIMEVEKK